jgi:hypothetical protein
MVSKITQCHLMLNVVLDSADEQKLEALLPIKEQGSISIDKITDRAALHTFFYSFLCNHLDEMSEMTHKVLPVSFVVDREEFDYKLSGEYTKVKRVKMIALYNNNDKTISTYTVTFEWFPTN